MKTAAGIRQVNVLVDTGSRIPIVFRRGLVPSGVLKTASFPVKFKTADGNLMTGGTHGLLLELRLPVVSLERLITARTIPLFAYEADIHGVDVIVG